VRPGGRDRRNQSFSPLFDNFVRVGNNINFAIITSSTHTPSRRPKLAAIRRNYWNRDRHDMESKYLI